jgi:hypothetical protein
MIEKYGDKLGTIKYNEWIEKQRNSKLGKKHTSQHNFNISKGARRKQSEETRLKIKKGMGKWCL